MLVGSEAALIVGRGIDAVLAASLFGTTPPTVLLHSPVLDLLFQDPGRDGGDHFEQDFPAGAAADCHLSSASAARMSAYRSRRSSNTRAGSSPVARTVAVRSVL